MRVRDTKIYILLTALVFLMVVTFNIFYISSFTTRAKELTYSDARPQYPPAFRRRSGIPDSGAYDPRR